ncbi:uncharacterized protein LOC121726754 [Aricia agestis]|uniref:uncharacterized protein LOC121726754 n=1 Tax=Aricia agestis TaxID=91739 RepID=UPI001C201F38|nr:uncharacterized protein LOC121726754 [Aricia agestis]
MEPGFNKGNSSNLPRVDCFTVARFFIRNKDIFTQDHKNAKRSPGESHGDDAVGFVQLRRENELCTVMCRVCLEQEVHSKQYTVTVIVDEQYEEIESAQCPDCESSAGICKHIIVFVMWLHRRSEEPSGSDIKCYWKKSLPWQLGIKLKYVTTSELSKTPKASFTLPSDDRFFKEFVKEARKRKITNCGLLKYLDATGTLLEE